MLFINVSTVMSQFFERNLFTSSSLMMSQLKSITSPSYSFDFISYTACSFCIFLIPIRAKDDSFGENSSPISLPEPCPAPVTTNFPLAFSFLFYRNRINVKSKKKSVN